MQTGLSAGNLYAPLDRNLKSNPTCARVRHRGLVAHLSFSAVPSISSGLMDTKSRLLREGVSGLLRPRTS
jgi:hypothetical protein